MSKFQQNTTICNFVFLYFFSYLMKFFVPFFCQRHVHSAMFSHNMQNNYLSNQHTTVLASTVVANFFLWPPSLNVHTHTRQQHPAFQTLIPSVLLSWRTHSSAASQATHLLAVYPRVSLLSTINSRQSTLVEDIMRYITVDFNPPRRRRSGTYPPLWYGYSRKKVTHLVSVLLIACMVCVCSQC